MIQVFPSRPMEVRKDIPPPKYPGLRYEFCPIGKPPRADAEIWDVRTGKWFPLPTRLYAHIRPAGSPTMPYGFYRQPKRPSRK